MTEIKHTPLPWHYIEEWRGIYDSPDIRGAQVRIAEIANTPDYKANAEFIVRACNSHYELVEALESANFTYLGDQYVAVINPDVVKQALNKAKGLCDEV